MTANEGGTADVVEFVHVLMIAGLFTFWMIAGAANL